MTISVVVLVYWWCQVGVVWIKLHVDRAAAYACHYHGEGDIKNCLYRPIAPVLCVFWITKAS